MITLKTGKDARDGLKRGMKKLHDPIAWSMGPAGRNFFYEERDQVKLTKDGASIARWIYGAGLLDRFERAGVSLLRRASQKSEEEAGDGTSAATVLAYHMAQNAEKYIDEGLNVMDIERGMRYAYGKIEAYIKTLVRDAKDETMWERVAYISSRDAKIAEIIRDAFKAVTPSGWIRVDKGDDWKEHDVELTIKKGMTFPRGYVDETMLNDTKNLRCILKDCPILVTDLKLYDERHAELLAAIATKVYQNGFKQFVVIGQLFSGVVKDFLAQNNIPWNQTWNTAEPRGMRILAIEAPGFGTEFTDEFCDDLAVMTGSKLISESRSTRLDHVRWEDLGRCEVVEAKKKETTIVNDDKKLAEAVEHRIGEIKAKLEKPDGDLEKRRYEQRLAALTGGSAIITVGGRNVENIGEKSARVEDAVLAAKAAHEEGIVPGGGMALVAAARDVDLAEKGRTFTKAEEAGIKIVFDALEAPMRQISQNCCMIPDDVIAAANKLEKNQTINMARGVIEKVDAFEDGVVDPFKVVRQSLLNAIETAIVFISTESVGVMIPEDKLRRPIFEVLDGDAAQSVALRKGTQEHVALPGDVGGED